MHLPPLTVKRISLIFVAAMCGDGSPENPERTAFFYYNDDGELMACYDPINGLPDAFKAPNAKVQRRAPLARPLEPHVR
jgi:hypothetical protein